MSTIVDSQRHEQIEIAWTYSTLAFLLLESPRPGPPSSCQKPKSRLVPWRIFLSLLWQAVISKFVISRQLMLVQLSSGVVVLIFRGLSLISGHPWRLTNLEARVCALQGIFQTSPNRLQGLKSKSRDDHFKSLEPPRYLLFLSYYISWLN